MSTNDSSGPLKRKHPSSSASSPGPASKRHRTAAGQTSKPKKKKKGFQNIQPKSKPKKHPINGLKKRIRSLQRQLASAPNLPATLQQTHERELASLRSQVEEAREAEQRIKCITRYHKVRFFERRKAERRIRRLKRAIKAAAEEASGVERKAIEEQLREAEVDLAYTKYYPLEVAYVSLFADGEGEAGEKVTRRPRMWEFVHEAFLEGQSQLAALREGKLKWKYNESISSGGGVAKPKPSQSARPKTKHEKEDVQNDKILGVSSESVTSGAHIKPATEGASKHLDVYQPPTPAKTGAKHEPRRERRARERREKALMDPSSYGQRADAKAVPAAKDDEDEGSGMGFFEP